MRQLTPKQQKSLKRIANVADHGELGVIDEINKLDDKVDETEIRLETKINTVKTEIEKKIR